MKKSLTLLFLGVTLTVLSQPSQGGGPFPVNYGSISNSIATNFNAYSNNILSISARSRILYDYAEGPAIDYSNPGVAVAAADFEIGGNLHASGITILGDASSQSTFISGPFFRRTNSIFSAGSDASYTYVSTNGNFFSTNAIAAGRWIGFTNGCLAVSGNSDGAGVISPSYLLGDGQIVFADNGSGNLEIVANNTIQDGTLSVIGTISGPGSGITALNASSLASGTVPVARLVANQNVGLFTVVQTNFISGVIYSNFYGAPLEVSSSASLAVAAVSGNSVMALECIGQATNQCGISTLVTSIAMAYTNTLSVFIPINTRYTFTNRSTGAGNSSTVVGGQIMVY